ncbi:MAG: hypothetical protein HRT47_11490 [Candidatus Caenarcaniphilales bacterium]|nr:hypothetical protein [Candidatus Caenarcaniphilales bacterium]
MHKKDTKTLEKLFSHPISMNLEWNEVKHMLETMGVEVETTHHNHTKIHYGEESMSFKSFHKNLGDKNEIIELQHFLKKVGLAPEEAK